jgi:uncharacterized membrane protein (DUF4010 family)
MMEQWVQLGIALGLGLLVGLQREWAKSQAAGIRTFPLITVLGTLCAMLSERLGGWILGAGLAGVAAVLVAITVRGRDDQHDPGLTTEVAALVMYVVGAILVTGHTAIAIAVGGAVAVLLQWKEVLHGFVRRIGETEIRAVFRVVLIGMVVLPVLPDRAFGPYGVLNPFRIWLLVVLIVGLSVGGYLASRFIGQRAGSVLGGVLGGLISSTATTVGYARRSKESPASSPFAATVIAIASTIVFVRVMFEVSLVAPDILPDVAPQLLVMLAWMALLSVVAYRLAHREKSEVAPSKDPAGLMTAVGFGALYAIVLLAVAVAKVHFGQAGLYVVSALSGLTDMDAITLSTAEMMRAERVSIDTGWRMMLVGALSNIGFKMLAITALAHPRLTRRMALLFVAAIAGGLVLLFAWPSGR